MPWPCPSGRALEEWEGRSYRWSISRSRRIRGIKKERRNEERNEQKGQGGGETKVGKARNSWRQEVDQRERGRNITEGTGGKKRRMKQRLVKFEKGGRKEK